MVSLALGSRCVIGKPYVEDVGNCDFLTGFLIIMPETLAFATNKSMGEKSYLIK